MGKHLLFNGQYEIEDRQHRPGWLWGMLHALDYHHWQYVKKLQKLLYNRKHHPRRRRLRCCAAPKTISFTHDAGKEPEQVDAEKEHLLGQHHIEKGEALAAEDISEREIDMNHLLSFHVRKPKHEHQIDSEMSHTSPRSSKVEDELFQRILQNPHFAIVKGFAGDREGIGKPRFTKARSFPFSDSAGPRHYRASTLQHKQSEVWFFREGDRQKMAPSNAALKQETTGSSLVSSQTIDHHGWNRLIISQFKGIKRRIRLALKQSRRGSLPAEMVSDQGSSSDYMKEISNDQVEANKLLKMTRLSSLNESLDKYAQLLGENFSAESKASKLNNSKSLSLRVDAKTSTPKTFRRRLSLPDYETITSLLGDLSYDNLYSGLSARTKPESNDSKELKMKGEPLDELPRTDSPYKSLEAGDAAMVTEGPSLIGGSADGLYAESDISGENSVESTRREHIILHGKESSISSKSTTEAEPSSPVSVLHSFLPQDKSTELEAPRPSEGLDLRPCTTLNDENACTRDEAADKLFTPDFRMVKEDECDFNFVKDVLRLGGFFESEVLEPWESIQLPLDPKAFDELEASELHEPECSDAYCVHQLLFDVINEALLDICERNFTYFPKAFSFCKFITRPITKGQHLLDEVWTRVKWYRGRRHETAPRLDDIVSWDMAKGDRWMDLEWESECVALELEDMILSELVNELVHS